MAEVPYGVPATGATVTSAPTSNSKISPPVGAHAAFLSATTQDIWVTLDGSVPSATNGMRIYAGQQPFFLPCAVSLQALNATSGGVLNICWLS